MVQSLTYGWALRWIYTDIDGSVRESFLGKYWIVGEVPARVNGYTTMVYRTRREARDMLRNFRKSYGDCEGSRKTYRRLAVVKVRVTVTETKRDFRDA